MNARKQQGAHTVEFAIVGSMFFVMLFGAIEFGRLMFTWNTLDEASRRGARVAAVCPPNHSAISRVAIFEGPVADSSGYADSSILHDLSEENIQINYLDAMGAALADPSTNYLDIAFVRVAVVDYEYHLIIPFFVQEFVLPPFTTVLPRESLGVSSEGTGCFGSTI